jgi:Tol biopolymer transport system component/tRNA A-37 threonylcarbamoyl transferase component Bud32
MTTRLAAALADRYRIDRELGQGGMATVYLAEDLKHKRNVAIKVLRPELAAVLGAERFVQEITTTAALQHPHILPLFDSGSADGFLFYVMPFIDGETLRSTLDRETQLGVDAAVKIATEVADALHYAHSRGVIHRDIKPENILLQSGRPMVADFGIALAVSAAAGGRMTETGLSLGTPHYMSPEQATAEKEITARSDIYSLASVLYEMLAGQPPHLGGSAQQIIMKIIAERVPVVTQFRKTVPPNVAAAVAKALEKLPADRFDSAKSFADALANPQYGLGAETLHANRRAGTVAGRRWALLGWGAGVVGVGLSVWALQTRSPTIDEPRVAMHLNIVLPDSAPLSFTDVGSINWGNPSLALSPDGHTLVYVALEGNRSRLYRRDLNGFEATPIAGTEGAFSPVVSPDGEWVAFLVGPELRKAPIKGGTAVPLAAITESYGIDWSPDGRILVTAREGTEVAWVPETGGAPQRIPTPVGVFPANPHILPGGRHALVWTTSSGDRVQWVGALDLVSGRTVALTRGGPVAIDSLETTSAIRGRQPRYLASGHLVYTTPTGLMAIAFDPATLAVSGTAVEVLSGVRTSPSSTQYAVSADGTLVYAPGTDAERGALVWVSRDGAVDSLGFAPQRYGTFALSPDGRRVVTLVKSVSSEYELWVYDLERMTENKVITRGTPYLPRWWPDGRRVMFTEMSSVAPYPQVVVRQLVESAGERDTLVVGWQLSDIGPDTSTAMGSGGFGRGIWTVPLAGGLEPVSIDSFPTAWGPAIAPDSRWIAYTSNEAGQYEVYVTDVRQRGARRKVSIAGGEEPVWSPRGDELFYRWGGQWFAVRVPSRGDSTFGRPTALFRGPYLNPFERSHDVSRDGRRHLLILGPTERSTGQLHVITNWTEAVKRRVSR